MILSNNHKHSTSFVWWSHVTKHVRCVHLLAYCYDRQCLPSMRTSLRNIRIKAETLSFYVVLDVAPLSSFEESSRKLKIKAEPDADLPSRTYTETAAPKPWPVDTVATSTTLSDQRYSPQKDASSTEASASPAEITSTYTSSPVGQSSTMPQLHTQSMITEASTTSQNATEQSRPLVRAVFTSFINIRVSFTVVTSRVKQLNRFESRHCLGWTRV